MTSTISPTSSTLDLTPAAAGRRSFWTLLVLLAGLAVGACSEPEPTETLIELSGPTMGTRYHVKIAPEAGTLPGRLSPDRLQGQIDQRLETVEDMMSTYRPESDLSRFNASKSTDWIPVPRPLLEVVEVSQTLSRMSGGMFDVTVGPLVDLWGFGPEPRAGEPPSAERIEAALARVGFGKLEVRPQPPALRKSLPGVRIDLSAIAKGYAVDQIAELLDGHGIANYLVEIGGELRGKGRKSGGRHWRVAIERPEPGVRAAQQIVTLDDQAMATSGDYRNFFEHQGRLYSHTIDPRSGQPVQHRLASVTVLADDCMSADGLATALLAMGDEAGPALAASHEIAALFILRSDDGFEQWASPAFQARLKRVPAAGG